MTVLAASSQESLKFEITNDPCNTGARAEPQHAGDNRIGRAISVRLCMTVDEVEHLTLPSCLGRHFQNCIPNRRGNRPGTSNKRIRTINNVFAEDLI